MSFATVVVTCAIVSHVAGHHSVSVLPGFAPPGLTRAVSLRLVFRVFLYHSDLGVYFLLTCLSAALSTPKAGDRTKNSSALWAEAALKMADRRLKLPSETLRKAVARLLVLGRGRKRVGVADFYNFW
jgi:hypothetical protein